jgi:hypothetical protein
MYEVGLIFIKKTFGTGNCRRFWKSGLVMEILNSNKMQNMNITFCENQFKGKLNFLKSCKIVVFMGILG